jgi:hypothetical protein
MADEEQVSAAVAKVAVMEPQRAAALRFASTGTREEKWLWPGHRLMRGMERCDGTSGWSPHRMSSMMMVMICPFSAGRC